jgi:predicted DNA-binding transcriptional regulator YafY
LETCCDILGIIRIVLINTLLSGILVRFLFICWTIRNRYKFNNKLLAIFSYLRFSVVLMLNSEDKLRPAEKIIGLYTLLLYSPKPWSLQRLRKAFNCSASTMLRLIEQLEGSNYGKIIKNKVGRESVYEIDKTDLKLPVMSFSAEAIGYLVMCRDISRPVLPQPIQKTLGTALTQLTALTQEASEGFSRSFARAWFKGIIDYSDFSEQFDILVKATRDEIICDLQYLKDLNGTIKDFIFAPKELVVYHETLYFRGWSLDSKLRQRFDLPTTLCLHRIKNVTVRDKSSKRLPELPPFEDSTFGIIDETLFQAVVKFDSEVALWISERHWSSDQTIERLEDGGILLTLTAKSQMEFQNWLLSFGRQAEVISPNWLRKEMAKEVEKLNLIYNSSAASSGSSGFQANN